MSLDASLKAASGLARHRNVLTKSERLQLLLSQGKMDAENPSVLAMPKVGHRKIAVGKKAAKKPEAEEAGKKKKK